MLRCCRVGLCCCCPIHPGTACSDGRCHLRIPHSHHHCQPQESHTPLQTRSVLSGTEIKNKNIKRNSVVWRGLLKCTINVHVHTCWDKMVTASLCLASRRLIPLTARMASPTCRPPHLSAGWPGWISEIKMGTPCSFPPWWEKTHKSIFNYFFGSFIRNARNF